jgi:large subunit ribosomal protein L15
MSPAARRPRAADKPADGDAEAATGESSPAGARGDGRSAGNGAAGGAGADWTGLHSLKPAPGSRRARKRVGRGEGSGTGKTAGRGQKGYGARSGAKRRARFEGGQMPIHMRMRKLRGPHMKKSMPFEPFRTHTQPVNLGDLDARFESGASVTLEALRAKGLGTRQNVPVKILAKGELGKPLTVHAHAFSASARERIEAAGGSCQIVET